MKISPEWEPQQPEVYRPFPLVHVYGVIIVTLALQLRVLQFNPPYPAVQRPLVARGGTSHAHRVFSSITSNLHIHEDNWLGYNPVNTGRLTNVGSMLDHRLRRWLNINPTLVKHSVLTAPMVDIQSR